MGMKIDEALETIKGERWILCQEKYIEAMNFITDIVNKYQKIEQILNDWENSGEEDDPINIIDNIEEVVEDGKTDND